LDKANPLVDGGLSITSNTVNPTCAIYSDQLGRSVSLTLTSRTGGGQILAGDNSNGLIISNDFGHPVRLQIGLQDACVVNADKSVSVNGDVTCNNGVISVSNLSSRIATLESGSSGSLVAYQNESTAFFAGVNQGSQYLKGGVVNLVKNRYRPVYRFTGFRTSSLSTTANVDTTVATLQYTGTQTASFTAMNSNTSNNGWTVEAIISFLTTGEQYIFDPRSGDIDNYGMAFGITGGKISTWARGATTGAQNIGAGANPKTSASTFVMQTGTWNHLAWVKLPSDANNIYLYQNGIACGSVPCGTNATTTQSWSKIFIGNIQGTYTGFHFRGRIAGLRVSNTALYSAQFTPPDVLLKQSSSTFCLGPGFTDMVNANISLSSVATTGAVEGVTDICSGRIFEMRYDTPGPACNVSDGFTNEMIMQYPTCSETRGFYGSMFNTTNNTWKVPTNGLYRFEVSHVFGNNSALTSGGGMYIGLFKINKTKSNTPFQPEYFAGAFARGSGTDTHGGIYVVTLPMLTTEDYQIKIGSTKGGTPNTGPFWSWVSTYCSLMLVDE
jgi:hypothetical protein